MFSSACGRIAAAVLAVLIMVAGCTSSDDRDEDALQVEQGEVLVGEVDGGKALIALVHTSKGVTVYTCGFDEQLDTHTGWFNGVPKTVGDDRVIPEIANPNGLVVAGRITGDEAKGTLTLASGEELEWEAERTSDNGAGLYAAEDAASLSGLIVAEDERMVGSSTLRLVSTTFDSGSTTTPSTVAPATTTTTLARFATTTTTKLQLSTDTKLTKNLPILIPRTRPTGSPVRVSIPIVPETPRLTTVIPITKPRTVTRTGAAIVFLVHGMSDSTGTPGADEAFDATACTGPGNTPFYSRCEWGPDFLSGLFGGGEGAGLVNLAGGDMTGNRYITGAEDVRQIDETLGLAQAANGCAADPTQEEEVDGATAAHFVAVPGDGSLDGQVPVPPRLSVFTTYRDSTRGIVESGRRITRQAYAAARWWEETYSETPQIFFVTQSFGGLATRFLLSNPTDSSLTGLNPDGVILCPEDHARMDYLRNRTTYALTLATPHEGSFLSEVGEPAKEFLRGALANIDAGLADHPLVRMTQSVETIAALVLTNPPNITGTARAEIANLIALLDTPALRDMRLANMERWNTGPIAPDRARRTEASPMVGAANELIPIYATLARSPGSTAFDSPLIPQGFEVYDAELPKEQGWIQSTSIASQFLVTQFSDVGWGSLDGPLADHATVLDRRGRIFDLSDPAAAAEDFVEQAAEGILGEPAAYFEGQFGGGLDGIITYLDSVEVEAFFPKVLIPIYTEHVWVLDLSGSIDVPMIAFTCGANRIVLDYEPLVRALLVAHGRTPAALDAIGSGDLVAVLAAAQIAVQDGVLLAEETMEWFQGKIAELDAIEGDCEIPLDAEDAVTDFFSLANIANWKVEGTSGPVPAPEWVETLGVNRDGEQDNDGAVHAASALGVQLGREPFFFEHDRGGSWYRLADNPRTERYNHGLQYQNDVGQWVQERFFAAGVGPVPQADGDSTWTQ